VKPEDLRGKARELYQTWRGLGLSESAAMEQVREAGLLRERRSEHDRLRETFIGLGLSERAAEVAAAGRDGRDLSEVASRPEPVPDTAVGAPLRVLARMRELQAEADRPGLSDAARRELLEVAVRLGEAALAGTGNRKRTPTRQVVESGGQRRVKLTEPGGRRT
jgi:hypothetical protein